jgi:hypothetical protein
MQATIEYEPVVTKLLEKSQQGRLDWGKQGRGEFVCEIDGQYKFTSRLTDDGYGLTMRDSEGDVIFSVAGEEAVLYDDPKKEELFNMLRDIYELARKKALNVDKKIATAAVLLDKV